MTSCREREEFVHGAGVWLLAWPKRAGSHCFTPTRDLIQVVAAVYIKRLLVGAAVHRFVILYAFSLSKGQLTRDCRQRRNCHYCPFYNDPSYFISRRFSSFTVLGFLFFLIYFFFPFRFWRDTQYSRRRYILASNSP